VETCFHGRHINPQIMAGLNSPDGWHLRDYEARGGYKALRKIIAEKITPEQVIAEVKASVAARARRRGLPDGPEVELHAAPVPGPEVSGLQFRRGRAGHLQGPRHPALQPACRDRRHDHRGLRDGHHRRLQLHPRRDLGDSTSASSGAGRGARRRAAWAATSWARTSPAPTSAAKRPACWSRSKASAASRESSRPSPRSSAPSAAPR
jgi:hypothetical protein